MNSAQWLSSGAVLGSLLASLAACGGSGGAGSSQVGSAASPVAPSSTGKVFALMDPQEPAANLQAYAALSSVDGLAYRATWAGMEPSQGSYNWVALDAAFAIVRTNHKKITVHVGPTGPGLPTWLAPLGMQSYTYTGPQGTRTDPVPWDGVYLARYALFIAALGSHIQASGNMDLLAAVSDAVPVAEMTIVGCQSNSLSGGTAYSRSQYLAAWKTTVGAYANAFPGISLFVSAPIAFICLNDGNDGQAFYTEVMNDALLKTKSAAVFVADLNALGSQRLQQVTGSISAQAAIGTQTIWSYTNDPTNRMQGTLSAAVCRGWKAGARYAEIYKADLDNTDAGVQAAIGQGRSGAGC
jgi:Beta-galactosidase